MWLYMSIVLVFGCGSGMNLMCKYGKRGPSVVAGMNQLVIIRNLLYRKSFGGGGGGGGSRMKYIVDSISIYNKAIG